MLSERRKTVTSNQRIDRRRFLAAGGVAGLGLLGVAGCGSGSVVKKNRVSGEADGAFGGAERGSDRVARTLTSEAPLPKPFTSDLPILPTLKPTGRRGGQDLYEITQRAADREILPGLKTSVWGYDGQFPGPTIAARRGEPIVVRMHNQLAVPTTTHLHGGITPAASDGYPTDLTVPRGYTKRVDAAVHAMSTGGGQKMAMGPTGTRPDPKVWTVHQGFKDYEYPIEQRSTMLWYHDHRMDFTGPQVWRGLAGAFIVRDEQEDKLGLPAGDKELVLVICDRAFAASGAFLYPSLDETLINHAGTKSEYTNGVMGDVILVNGAPWPVAKVANTRYRLRLLNASNARQYSLQLHATAGEKRPPFVQIGSDGGLLAEPQRLTSIPIAQAERFDVIVDFSKYPVGTELVLTNSLDKGTTGQVMKFVVDREEKDQSTPLPKRLVPDFEVLKKSQAVTARRFDFRFNYDAKTWTINGNPFDPTKSLASPELDTVALWHLSSNANDSSHPVHMHLAHFQVISRNGHQPSLADAGWKDTVNLAPHGQVDVLVKFTGFKGRYMLHCHNLEHEDMAMMANFTVA